MLSASTFIRTRTVLGTSLICALTAALAVGCWVLRPDLMLVERVVFTGQLEASPTELRHLADLRNGTRIWEVDTERMERGIERHPWVRQATVRRVFPDRVKVEIDEHKPVALLHFGSMFYVDEQGVAFLPARSSDLDYPSLTGITPELERDHPELPRLVVSTALHLLAELDTRGLVARDRVDEVNFSRTRGFTVRTQGSRVLFALDELDLQLDRFATLLSSGTVDLDHAFHVDLGPRSVAIVRPLGSPGEG